MTPPEVLESFQRQGRQALDEPAAKSVLAAYGITVPGGITVGRGEEPTLAGLRAPFVAKIISPDALHKSDVGGVKVELADRRAALQAVRDLERLAAAKNIRLDGVLVEEMAAPGIELVIGGLIDPRFGPVVMLGLGGVFVEIYKDTVFRVCPITALDAAEMIDGLRAAPLLRGARGTSAVNEALITSTLLKVAGENGLLMQLGGAISELDINPFIVSANVACACDARIVLAGANA